MSDAILREDRALDLHYAGKDDAAIAVALTSEMPFGARMVSEAEAREMRQAAFRRQRRQFPERAEGIERLEAENKTIADDIKDVYAEAKGNGFDTKVLRKVISLRKQDQNERAEQDAILDLYLQALGMGIQERLPFEEAA